MKSIMIALFATAVFSPAVGARLQPTPAVVAFTHVVIVDLVEAC